MTTHPPHVTPDLGGQVALVTGASGGLGRAFALALAKAGARVALTARTASALAETVGLIEHAGGHAIAIPADVSAPDALTDLVNHAESRFGGIDVLVNNAGVLGPLGHDWHIAPDEWWRTFEVNVLGPFRCARTVLPGMVARQRGRIVNVSSGAGFSRLPQMSAYCASKAALTQWTKTLAEELKPHGITAFAFNPGFVRTTSMGTGMTAPGVPDATATLFNTFLQQGRDVPVERCVRMLLFLVSGSADALSGRFVRSQDDEADLVRRAGEILERDLHTVTLRT
jgi:NAD(P)-dependent dehydrogenase (short-subunit alcohol dehydrogenase family)